MRFSVERLRVGLLVGAGLLVAVIAGFLVYAKYQAHRIIRDLPARLGATITREVNNYTYSQSYKGKTVFTIHAAKGVEHKDGRMALHDVDLVMYGRKGDRADHISGAEFEYDEKAQVVRALGLVHLDLQSPPAEESKALAGRASTKQEKAPVDRVIHITTSGLVYAQKEQVATTDQPIEFSFGGLTGKAQGAVYNSGTGHVVLESAVRVSGLEHGAAVLLTATHAELDRETELARLDHARYSSDGETVEAEVGLIHMRADGSAERIEGEQHVRLERVGGGMVTANHGEMTLDAKNRPTLAVLNGAVSFADDEPLRQGRGQAGQATLHFDGLGHVERVSLLGGTDRARAGRVESMERVRAAVGPGGLAPWSVRELSAESVELVLGTNAAGKEELRGATAVGGARLTTSQLAGAAQGGTESVAAKGAGKAETTKLAGDRLEARFVETHGQAHVSAVHGVGHTVLEQVGAKGIEQVSAGDRLDVSFREAQRVGGAKNAGAVEVATAVQEGNVAITRTVPAAAANAPAAGRGASVNRSAGPEVQHARAGRASFDRDNDLLTLAGAVEMWDASSRLLADRVQMEQGSGDATADGAVRVTYEPAAGGAGQAGGQQPTHVLAERAELKHDAGRATFYGAGGSAGAVGQKLARLWQSGVEGGGGSQVEAPMLVLEQEQHRLTARGLGAGAPMAVRTVLVNGGRKTQSDSANGGDATAGQIQGLVMGAAPKSAGKAGASRKGAGASSGAGASGVVRVTSRELAYSDELRQAEFSGGVRVLDAGGDLRAQQVTAYLQPAKAGAAAQKAQRGPADGLLGGGVERIVANGAVDMTQPGRHASGERLVYTAADQMFVLTGTAAAPPKVVDAEQGTATGASLRFHTGDDSVVIAGGNGVPAGQKVRTETKVKQ